MNDYLGAGVGLLIGAFTCAAIFFSIAADEDLFLVPFACAAVGIVLLIIGATQPGALQPVENSTTDWHQQCVKAGGRPHTLGDEYLCVTPQGTVLGKRHT